MKQILVPVFAVALAATPIIAEEAPTEGDGSQSLMEQGMELFMEGLRKEMEPALDDLQGLAETIGPSMQTFLAEMGPALADIASQVEDWSVYEMPEVLPNGDIIIRRKPEEDRPDQSPDAPEADPPAGTTDI